MWRNDIKCKYMFMFSLKKKIARKGLIPVAVYIDGLAQDCSNSIANALELLQSCTKPSICSLVLAIQAGHWPGREFQGTNCHSSWSYPVLSRVSSMNCDMGQYLDKAGTMRIPMYYNDRSMHVEVFKTNGHPENWAGPVKFDPGQVKIMIDHIRREIFWTFLGD